MSATRGPVPQRTELRRRTNAPEDGMEVTKGRSGGEPTWMEPPGDDETDEGRRQRWHPVAENWYLGLATSGQSDYYEQSDVDTAYILAEQISRLLKPQFVGMQERWNREAQQMERVPAWITRHISGGDLSAVLKGMSMLLVTEGERRRARIELQRGGAEEEQETAGQAAVRETRHALLGVVDGGLAQGR